MMSEHNVDVISSLIFWVMFKFVNLIADRATIESREPLTKNVMDVYRVIFIAKMGAPSTECKLKLTFSCS